MDTELMHIIKKAEDFHGHLGPFLVIGVRMGRIGIKKMKVKENGKKLRITAMLKYKVPFSCVVDGIQVATKCTLGNQKLKLIDSTGIAAEFELQEREKIIITVNPVTFNKLRDSLLSDNVSPQETKKLAHFIASMPEEELFTIESK